MGRQVWGLAVAAAIAAAGCGASMPPPAATVTGAVTFQGQPLAAGLVIFTPDPERGHRGKPARAELAADGRYQLSLDGSTAIPTGWYRVAIVAVPTGGAAFPTQLARPDMSGLVREVKPDGENVFDFAVEVNSR